MTGTLAALRVGPVDLVEPAGALSAALAAVALPGPRVGRRARLRDGCTSCMACVDRCPSAALAARCRR